MSKSPEIHQIEGLIKHNFGSSGLIKYRHHCINSYDVKLRDQFAMFALQALDIPGVYIGDKSIAKDCYKFADNMLKVRQEHYES